MPVIHLGFCTSDVLNVSGRKCPQTRKERFQPCNSDGDVFDWGFLLKTESGQIPSIFLTV